MSMALSIRPSDNRGLFNFACTNDFLEEMEAIHDQVAREAFGLFEQRGRNGGSALDDWLHAEAKLLNPVPVTIADEKDHLKVRAEVPGFAMNELKVHVDGQQLQICGSSEKKSKKAEKKSGEQETLTSSQKICCSISLPARVKGDVASATLDKGVLTLTLPKADPAKGTTVKAA